MFFSVWVHLGSHCQQVSSVTNAIDTVRRSLSNYAQSFAYAKKHFTETRKFLLSGLENLKEKANKSSFGMFNYLIHFYLIYFIWDSWEHNDCKKRPILSPCTQKNTISSVVIRQLSERWWLILTFSKSSKIFFYTFKKKFPLEKHQMQSSVCSHLFL